MLDARLEPHVVAQVGPVGPRVCAARSVVEMSNRRLDDDASCQLTHSPRVGIDSPAACDQSGAAHRRRGPERSASSSAGGQRVAGVPAPSVSATSTAMASISRGVGQQKHQPLPTSADFRSTNRGRRWVLLTGRSWQRLIVSSSVPLFAERGPAAFRLKLVGRLCPCTAWTDSARRSSLDDGRNERDA